MCVKVIGSYLFFIFYLKHELMIIINFDLKNNFFIAKVVKETSFFRFLTMLKSSIDHPIRYIMEKVHSIFIRVYLI
jgi:hypothetical protein